MKNLHLFRFIKWYNPFSWITVGFHNNTKVIHAQWWSWVLAPAYLTILSILKIRKKKIVFTIHNVYPHEKSIIKNFLNSCVLKLADEYIVHNKKNKDLFSRLIRNTKPIHIIPHGIVSIKKNSKSISQLRNEYDFSEFSKILLFFGNIREYKGLNVLLESISKMKRENIKLIIAGKPWSNFKENQKYY